MVGNGKMRKNIVLIDYIKKNYHNNLFHVKDPKIPSDIRGLIYRYLCIKGNLPNATSIYFEQVCEKKKCSKGATTYMKKSFRLKEMK